MSEKKHTGNFLSRILPWKLYKLLANGLIIVPKYYKSLIADAEKYFDMSLEDHPHKDIMLMRKMGHIIDKGLHRDDVAPGHSKDFYNDLKYLLSKIENSEYRDDPTVIWAKGKLTKYEELQSNPEGFVPFRQNTPKSTVSFEQLLQVIKDRRSNRCFTSQTVADEIINKLKETVDWAPNSCNKQPVRLFVTNDTELTKKCLACCAGGTGFSENIPSFWCFTANVRGYVWPTEFYLPAIDVSLGAENVFLAAHTLGLSGTVLSWAQKSESDEIVLRRLLRIPEDYTIIFCAVMGYADFGYLAPTRKRLE